MVIQLTGTISDIKGTPLASQELSIRLVDADGNPVQGTAYYEATVNSSDWRVLEIDSISVRTSAQGTFSVDLFPSEKLFPRCLYELSVGNSKWVFEMPMVPADLSKVLSDRWGT